jgi:hypothetical protein
MQQQIDPTAGKEWVLARARSISLGVRLVQAEIEEIGICLKNDWITPQRAADDLAALERLPVYIGAILLCQAHEGEPTVVPS